MSQNARRRRGLRPARQRRQRFRYAGVGNISGTWSRAKSPRDWCRTTARSACISAQRVQQFEYQRAPGSLLIMHSDGVSARGSPRERQQLFAHHPAIIAAALYRDYGRDHDDATIVVVVA